jgi:tetratricopeptide (TPR) repeat protein
MARWYALTHVCCLLLMLPCAPARPQTADVDSLDSAQSLLDRGLFRDAANAARHYLQAHPSSAEAHYLLGYVLFKANDPQSSLSEYEIAARYRPPGATDFEVMGANYFLLEVYPAADKWLTKSIELNPRDPLALYLLGRTKYNEKYFEQAVQFLTECLKIDPGNIKAETNLGLSYEKLGKTEAALNSYRAAIALEHSDAPRNSEPYLYLGTLLLDTGSLAAAIPYLREAVDIAGDDAQAHLELGKGYLLANDLPGAQAELEKAVKLNPQAAPARFLLAEAYRKRGKTDQARAESDRYAELAAGHSSPDDVLSEARSLIEHGHTADAEQSIRRYLSLHRNSPDAHYLLGYVLFKEQRAKESLAAYTDAARYRTPSASDLEVVAGDYVLLKDYEDADKWFSKTVEWDSGNLQALYYLGRTKYNENRFDEAVAIFIRLLKLDPKNVKAEDNLGLSYEGLGRMDDAIAAYQASISWQTGSSAGDAGPYIDLGNVLVETDRAPDAITYLLKALEISPREVRAHRALGKAYLHLNQLDKAQAEFEECIALEPQNATAHFMLAQVYRKRGFLEKARAETERYTQLSAAHSAPESSQ